MNSIDDKTGIIRITDETPDHEAITALIRALFAYGFQRRDDEFTEIVFSNRKVTPTPEPSAKQEIIVTHRTPGPMVKVQNAFRHWWAQLGANDCLVVMFEKRPIFWGDDDSVL